MSNAASAIVPLAENRRELLARLVEGLDATALNWLSGYAAGLAARAGEPAPAPNVTAAALQRLTVLYGSQTGNARRQAERLAHDAQAAGLAVRLLRADAYPARELANERLLAVVISTQGDGDPPDDARGFVEFLSSRRAPKLPELRFTVLGLGDSSYPKFCSVGRAIDARLAELGATRLADRADADVDIESVANPWQERTLAEVREALKAQVPLATVTPLRPHVAVVTTWSRDKPFAATVLANQRITGRDSARDVRHIELSLEGSGPGYEPGDALGVWPRNPPALVDAVLDALNLDGDGLVEHAGASLTLRDWLATRRELTRLARPFVTRHAKLARSAPLEAVLDQGNTAGFAELARTHQVIDLLRTHPAAWAAQEFVAALRPLAPRLYSIASSRSAVGAEAHLTVAHVAYEAFGFAHWGAASHDLAGLAEGAHANVFIEANERFRLPADPSRDIIMIGPGTGVAPYRGFVQERRESGARGRNWLVFGNPHFADDFLYQVEWQAALRDGSLQRLDLAFSRDAAQKTYVQQRLRENGRDLFEWIENGAHVYVCGDAARMARDVHAALVDVVASHGGRDRDGAEEYLSGLIRQGRYARDVY
jgi:sulfite reductase (NADPH) flavoprotein alpha-component